MKAALAAILIAAGCFPGLAGAETLHLKTVEILDNGWNPPIPGYSFLAPADWTIEGGIEWHKSAGTACVTRLVVNDVRIISPDGRFAIELFPEYTGLWSDDPQMRQSLDSTVGQCPLAEPMDAKGFVSSVLLPALRPSAEITDTEPIADAAAAFWNEMEPLTSVAGDQTTLTADAAKVMLSRDGAREEILAIAAVWTWQYTVPSADDPKKVIPLAKTVMTMSSRDFGYRFPPGQKAAAEPIFATVLSTIRINQAWNQVLQQILRPREPIDWITRNRQEIIRRSMKVLPKISSDDWRKTAPKGADAVSAAWGRAIGGIRRYRDAPRDADIVLPAGYDRAWSNGRGEYFLSTTEGFSPPLDETWTEIRPVP